MDVFPDCTLLGGAPFNVACHLQAFGLSPLFISRTGNDAYRQQIMDAMHSKGMTTCGMQTDIQYPTGQVTVHVVDKQHEFEILDQQAYDFMAAEAARIAALSAAPTLVYFGTLAQRHATTRNALADLLAAIDAPRFMDLNLRQPWFDLDVIQHSLTLADTVKLNDEELATLAQMLYLQGDDMQAQVEAMIAGYELGSVIVTCGSHGAWLLDKDGTLIHDAGNDPGTAVVDTVGAGDAFAAVFILGKLLQWSDELALSRANNFAAAICHIRGAIPQDQNFYAPFLQGWGLAEAERA
jgi:fructokinase